jgi:hypothetical protein
VLKYDLRTYVPGSVQGERDRSFWLDSWLKSYRKSEWAGVCPNHLYFDLHRIIVDSLVDRGAIITMITTPEQPDSFMGFLCEERGVLHYAYLKEPYRRLRMGTEIIHERMGKKFSYTFKTRYSRYFKSSAWDLSFEPELVRKKKTEVDE